VAQPWWREQVESLASVAPQWVDQASAGPGRTPLVVSPIQAFVSLVGTADAAAEKERLARAVAEAESLLAASEAKLANPQFRERAPAEVVDKERARATESAARLAKLQAQLEALG
jgi:valyl-tRNA synthetase